MAAPPGSQPSFRPPGYNILPPQQRPPPVPAASATWPPPPSQPWQGNPSAAPPQRWPGGPPPPGPPLPGPGARPVGPPSAAAPPLPPPTLRPNFGAPPPRFPGSGPPPSYQDPAPTLTPPPPLPQMSPQYPVQAARPPPAVGPPQFLNGPAPYYGNDNSGLPPPAVPSWQPRPSARVYPDPYGVPPPVQPSMPTQTMPPLPASGMAHGLSQPGSPGTMMGAAGSRVDSNQVPRPQPNAVSVEFETRVNGQANLPPPATSNFIVKDTGNCSPRMIRCTLNQIPCSADLLSTSGMPLAIMVQPLALPHPAEDPIQIVDFGESGPVRCSRCKAYINPFMKFSDQGRRFTCNICGFVNETPREYQCNLGPDGRRRDADERPELCKGSVEFVASREYLVRDPMPPVYLFLVDVSMNAVQTGATAAACSAIQRALEDLPGGARTRVGVATFDTSLHFYSLNKSLQQACMMVVPDIHDVYTPLHTDLIVPLVECREQLQQLLDSIPMMFQDSRICDSALGAAMKGAYLAMKPTGGKLLAFQSVLPSVGICALTAREVEGKTLNEKEAQKLLLPADKSLKTMAIEFAESQVCVDLFLTSQTYVDIASLGAVALTTGGQVYAYHHFKSTVDSAKLYNDLRWNLTRPQGLEAVMRVRSSQGIQVQDYFGSFCRRTVTDIDFPAIDCDKTIMVTFKHDEKLQEQSECCFQCALLYTTISGERRIRVNTISLPCTTMLVNLFRGADLDAQLTYFLKNAAREVTTIPPPQVKEKLSEHCVDILYAYRKFCATATSSGQLILPEALKLLPLYTLALMKSVGLRSDVRVDERSYWLTRVVSLPASLAVPLVYPRMFSIHDIPPKDGDGSVLPPCVPSLSSENLDHDSVFLLETGEDAYILVGKSVSRDLLSQLFGLQSVDEIVPGQFLLQEFPNDASKRLNEVVNEIRRQRCSYLRLHLLKRGDPQEMLFFSFLIEDKSVDVSYVEFLVRVHKQIQAKMKQ